MGLHEKPRRGPEKMCGGKINFEERLIGEERQQLLFKKK
jgi:hypothetical protein